MKAILVRRILRLNSTRRLPNLKAAILPRFSAVPNHLPPLGVDWRRSNERDC